MTATVETELVYIGVCSECGTASPPGDQAEADEWSAAHDAENHAEDDGNDEAYEKFKEARHGD